MGNDNEKFMTYEDAAEILSVSKSTIKNYIDLGKFRAVKLDYRTPRIVKSSFDSYLSSLLTTCTTSGNEHNQHND